MRKGRIILAGLALVTIGSLWRTVSVERQKREIADAYAKAQALISQVEAERAHLDGELVEAQGRLEDQTAEFSSLQQELSRVQRQLDQTAMELVSLQRDHQELQEENASLFTQVSSVTAEKQALEAKLSSIKELKLAIRDVRRKMWNDRFAGWHAHVRVARAADHDLASGNRGFVVRDGRTTLGAAPKLQVHVLDPQPQ